MITKKILNIDGKTNVQFNFEGASLDMCTKEINRYISEIERLNKFTNVVLVEHENGFVDFKVDGSHLSKGDLKDILNYIQSIINASATYRTMEYKQGILVAKNRLKQII